MSMAENFSPPETLAKHSSVVVSKPRTRDLLLVLVFACLRNVACLATRIFPSGFYIRFLEEKNLNKTFGTVCISMTLTTSAASPYLFKYLPNSIRKISLAKRCTILFVSNAIFLALMGSVDVVLERYQNGELVFGIIFVLRSVQGFAVGLIFQIVQGEVVDLYLKEHKMFIVIISSAMHVSSIVCSILGVWLYMHGGWVLVGTGVAALNIPPLLLIIPVMRRIKSHEDPVEDTTDDKDSSKDYEEEEEPQKNSKMTPLRRLAYYMPEVAVFINNMMFNLLIYVIPARMVMYTGRSLKTAVIFTNLLNLFSLISAVILGYLAEKMFNVFNIMIFGNIVFHIGCILAFGSTTKFLHFRFDFEVGSVLVGFGDAAIINLAIMSKFLLYEKWGESVAGLGARSTAVNNLVLNLAAAVGTILSGLTLTRESEIPALGTTGGAFLVVTISLVLCKLVK